MALDTRKPVNELTTGDLRDFPIWEYALDEEGRPGQDETWVRPVSGKTVPKDHYSQIVHAKFRTVGDVVVDGFVLVDTTPGKVEVTPGAIVGAFGYLCIPTVSRSVAVREGIDWSIAERDDLVAGLAIPENQVFPLRFRLTVNIAGENDERDGVVE